MGLITRITLVSMHALVVFSQHDGNVYLLLTGGPSRGSMTSSKRALWGLYKEACRKFTSDWTELALREQLNSLEAGEALEA